MEANQTPFQAGNIVDMVEELQVEITRHTLKMNELPLAIQASHDCYHYSVHAYFMYST